MDRAGLDPEWKGFLKAVSSAGVWEEISAPLAGSSGRGGDLLLEEEEERRRSSRACSPEVGALSRVHYSGCVRGPCPSVRPVLGVCSTAAAAAAACHGVASQ